MSKNSAFSKIETYKELEATIRMVRNRIALNPVEQPVSQLMAGHAPSISWHDVALLAIRAVRKLLN